MPSFQRRIVNGDIFLNNWVIVSASSCLAILFFYLFTLLLPCCSSGSPPSGSPQLAPNKTIHNYTYINYKLANQPLAHFFHFPFARIIGRRKKTLIIRYSHFGFREWVLRKLAIISLFHFPFYFEKTKDARICLLVFLLKGGSGGDSLFVILVFGNEYWDNEPSFHFLHFAFYFEKQPIQTHTWSDCGFLCLAGFTAASSSCSPGASRSRPCSATTSPTPVPSRSSEVMWPRDPPSGSSWPGPQSSHHSLHSSSSFTLTLLHFEKRILVFI